MIDDLITDDEKINSDKLESFYKDKTKVHIILKRILSNGDNSWLNGEIIKKSTKRIWILKEDKLGEIRISISEIKDIDKLKKVVER